MSDQLFYYMNQGTEVCVWIRGFEDDRWEGTLVWRNSDYIELSPAKFNVSEFKSVRIHNNDIVAVAVVK